MGVRSWISGLFANSDRSPWGSFWFEPVGVHTTAGMRVTAENALQLSAVFACVRIIASQFASLPFVLYRTRRDGGKKRVTDHPVYQLLARRPNAYQNAFEWREMMAGHLVLRGNAFNQIVANRQGEITALIPLHPDRVTIDLLSNGDYRYKYNTLTGSEQVFPRGQIWHLRGLSSDGIIGLSPIALARNGIGGALAAQDYGSRFFANDAKPLSGYIEYPGSFKDKMARDQFRESLQESQTGANRGKIAVFEFGMKYHQLGLTNEDAQFLETRKFHVNDIARWFGVPPHKIGDLDRSTNNNIEQQAQEFVQECLGPMAERWEASIEAELLLDEEGLEAEFLFSQLLRGDSVARAQYYNAGINGGWLTRNEARLSENLNPLPGLDRPLRPLNMAEEGDAPGSETPTITPPSHTPPGTPSNVRLNALAVAAAKRVARREMELIARARSSADRDAALLEVYGKHAGFVASVMTLPHEVATEYCASQIDLAANPDHEIADLEILARERLTHLALTGQLT